MDSQPHPRKDPKYPATLTPEHLEAIFQGADDLCIRRVNTAQGEVRLYFVDGLVASSEISEYVVKPLQQGRAVTNAVETPAADLDQAASLLVNGFCLVLWPGGEALGYEVKTGEKRGISGPEVENTIKGAKDAFTETVRTNTSLLRRHLRTPELRVAEQIVGRRSLTQVSVCWVAGLTNPDYVRAVQQRLETIDVDGLLTPAAVEEYLTGGRKTAFPLALYTQRADRFAWGLTAGRVGVLVDGLPLGYLLPCTLGDQLESPEDRGGNYQTASAVRFLRYVSVGVGLLLPGIFAAVSLYHQEMIPLKLLRAIWDSRQAVPMPTGAEVLLLLIAFELLQEAGLHLPQNLGQAASIIGGLVVGTAAVEASLISPASLIVVAAAGICGFTLPQQDLADALRLWRFAITLGGAAAGLAGVTGVFLLLLLHLGDLESLGLSYLSPVDQGDLPPLRPRLQTEKLRKRVLRPENRRNQR